MVCQVSQKLQAEADLRSLSMTVASVGRERSLRASCGKAIYIFGSSFRWRSFEAGNFKVHFNQHAAPNCG